MSIRKTSFTSGIFGLDSRTRLPRKYQNLSKSIGYLHYSDKNKYARCTVFCVAKDIIATSGHCFFNPKFSPLTPFSNSIVVIGAGAHRTRSKLRGRNWIERHANMISGCAGTSCRLATNDGKQLDWAIARLETPLCEGRTLHTYTSESFVNYVDWLSNDKLFTISYPGRKSYRQPTYATDCSDKHNEAYLSLAGPLNYLFNHLQWAPHRCDSVPGMSGAPLFVNDDTKGISVLGVHSGVIGIETSPHSFVTNLATRSSAFHRQTALLETARPVLARSSVRKIQRALKNSGGYRGAIDGVYGPATRAAILQVELDMNLLPTGWPTVAILKASELAEHRGFKIGFGFLKYLRDGGDISFRTFWRPGEGGVRRVDGYNAFFLSPTLPAWGWSLRSSTPHQAMGRAKKNCNTMFSNLAGSKTIEPDCVLAALGDTTAWKKPTAEIEELVNDYLERGLREALESYNDYRLAKGAKVVLVDFEEVAIVPSWGRDSLREAVLAAQTECHANGLNCSLYAVDGLFAEDVSDGKVDALVEQFRDGWRVGLEAFNKGAYEAAARIWARLAEAGNRKAAFRLAEMFEFAEGVTKDDREAARYYLMAAGGNHPIAQQRIASRYRDGRGVTRSLMQSLKWYFILQANHEASAAQRNAARSEVDRFSGMYVLEGFPGARDMLRGAEAAANAWRNARKGQSKP
jgi:hypothetical protein